MVSLAGPLGHGIWLFEVCAHSAIRTSAAFLHCRCPKGKQKHAREGFDFVVPATFANGFFWAKEVLEAYRTLAPARQRLAGLCFSDEGRPWTILEVQETMQNEMAVFLDNPEDITTYSWRRMAPTVAQLLECRPEEMAALGDWQNKGEQPEVGQMAFHYYSSAKYAASIKVKSLVWGATAKLTSNLLWEAIPQAELEAARNHGLAEADRLLRQDRQPIWASSQSFQDVRKRLKLSQQFVEAAQQAREEAEAAPAPQMPDQLNGKVLTATLKNGKAICPDFQTDECPNPADTCPFGVHLCAILQKSGRACGGKRGAGGNIKRAVMAASSVPTAPKPSATLVPAALGEKAQFTRKRAAASGATDDEVADVMRAAVKTARGKAAPKTPPKATAVAAPKTPPKAMPKAPMKAATKSAPGKPQVKAMPKKGRGKATGHALDEHLERLGVGSGTAQAPTCIWTSRKGGSIYLAGLPMRQTVDKFPKTALQICCFPHGPESRGG